MKFLKLRFKNFLVSYGFSKEIGKEIFEKAQEIVNLNQDILLQFFDDPDYSHLDRASFLCVGFNSFHMDTSVSEFIKNFDPIQSYTQLRPLITKEILNLPGLK